MIKHNFFYITAFYTSECFSMILFLSRSFLVFPKAFSGIFLDNFWLLSSGLHTKLSPVGYAAEFLQNNLGPSAYNPDKLNNNLCIL